jgi:2-oxoglutarate ferredoxin oxidoreductase subunit alpha
VLGWGSSYGPIGVACRRLRARGEKIANAHLKHMNPLPRNTGEVLRRFDKVVIPENNTGQLSRLIRSDFLVDAISITSVRGIPFRAADLEEQLQEVV